MAQSPLKHATNCRCNTFNNRVLWIGFACWSAGYAIYMSRWQLNKMLLCIISVRKSLAQCMIEVYQCGIRMKRIESSIDKKQMIFVESNDLATEILSTVAYNVKSGEIGREKKWKSYKDATGQFSIQRRKQQEPKRMAQAKVLLCSDFFFLFCSSSSSFLLFL